MSDSVRKKLAERPRSKRFSGKLNIRKLTEDAAAYQQSPTEPKVDGERRRCSGSGTFASAQTPDSSLPVSKDAPRPPMTPSSPKASVQKPGPFVGVSGPMAGLKSLLGPLKLRSSSDETTEDGGAWLSFLQSTSSQLHNAGSQLIAGVMDLTTTIDDTVDIFLSSLGVSNDLVDDPTARPGSSSAEAAGGQQSESSAPKISRCDLSPCPTAETRDNEITRELRAARTSHDVQRSRESAGAPSNARSTVSQRPNGGAGAPDGLEFASESLIGKSVGADGAGDLWNADFEADAFEEPSSPHRASSAAGAVRPASCSKRLFCDDSSAAAALDSDRSPLHPITPNPSSPQLQSEWTGTASTPPHHAPPTTQSRCSKATRLCEPEDPGSPKSPGKDENGGNTALNSSAAASTTPRKPPELASREACSSLRKCAKGARLSPARRAAGTPAGGGTPIRRAEVRALKHQCAELTSKVQQFQADCAALMAENERLRSCKHASAALEHDPLAEQLAFQLQHLLEEKAKLVQEKQRLAHENSNLSQLLEYATASIGAPDDVAWQPDEQDEDMCPSPSMPFGAENALAAWDGAAEPEVVQL